MSEENDSPALAQVADFPPDETALVGAAIGYAQVRHRQDIV